MLTSCASSLPTAHGGPDKQARSATVETNFTDYIICLIFVFNLLYNSFANRSELGNNRMLRENGPCHKQRNTDAIKSLNQEKLDASATIYRAWSKSPVTT